jgi:1-aminocyclopropane-1-carboxylate deaminase/D-cysteine desulfhydrase-like pyridoxal-dependent ACC family enzyme
MTNNPIAGLRRGAIDRVALGAFPTPLEPAPRLAAALGLAALWLKREDLSGAALGGNKIRKLELVLAEAQAQGCDSVISTAGQQSNLCRALAGVCARIGMRCTLLLRGSRPNRLSGNLLLDDIFGAEVRFIDVTDPWDPRVRETLASIAAELRARGRKPYVLHLTGDSAEIAIAAWVDGARELAEQWRAHDLRPDRLVVAAGSGLTAAGIALGLKLAGSTCRVVAISVQQPASRLAPWIIDAAGRAAARYGYPVRLEAADIDVVDEFIGAGYGVASADAVAAVRQAGCHEGVVLDPVYTGKAMAGLIALVRSGRIDRHACVVFVHSGGLPGLFHAASAFDG